jgi:hypothetical protein
VPRIPIHDEGAPIACTAAGAGLEARMRAVEGLRARLVSVDRTEAGILVHFPSDAEVELEVLRFAGEEQACCGFFGFEVAATSAAVVLRWEGPTDAAPIFDGLRAFLAGDEPITALSGLL